MKRVSSTGERLYRRPHSNRSRTLLRAATVAGGIVWFLVGLLASLFGFYISFLNSVQMFLVALTVGGLAWVTGFIVLGRVADGLAPLSSIDVEQGGRRHQRD